MPDAQRVFARHMDRAVDDEAGLVGRIFLWPYGLSILVHFDETRSGHFVEAQAVRVDEEMVLRSGHARADVGVDELRPAELVGDAVGGGELHPQRALGGVDAGL